MKSVLFYASSRVAILALALTVYCLGQAAAGAAAMGSAFTYQGRLSVGANPCNGTYDLGFALYDAATGGNVVGGTFTNPGVAVSNGLFLVTVDFGSTAFGGDSRWLEVSVRTNNGGAFSTLSPRQCVSPTPYALAAGNLVGALPAGQLSGTYNNAVTFNNSASSFAGNGAGLTGVNAATLGGLGASGFWQTTGNAGTIAGVNFLGTSDNQPLELKVNGQRVLRLEPAGPARTYPNVLGGDSANVLLTNTTGSFIGGGSGNSVTQTIYAGMSTAPKFATISGGTSNLIQGSTDSCTIGGGRANRLNADNPFGEARSSTISGGEGNQLGVGSDISTDGATISGGLSNTVDASFASLGGGQGNVIGHASSYGTIAGGHTNQISGYCLASTIGGGQQNSVSTFADYALIAGGQGNLIGGAGSSSSIGGGQGNTISGPSLNAGRGAVIGGGWGNTIGPASSCSLIAGGQTNTTAGSFATIAGGQFNFATNNAFAAGSHASAQWPGSFVWADASATSTFAASVPNQVCFRCNGGVLFSSGTSGGNQQVAWMPGNGGWSFTSDRNLKDRFSEVDSLAVLAKVSKLPLSEWSYKDHEQRHIGPMAQDFHALFPLNANDKMIDDVDLHGVALAAIQGLNHKVETDEAALRAENAELRARLEKLERLIRSMQGGAK